jgi:hypothetical protein
LIIGVLLEIYIWMKKTGQTGRKDVQWRIVEWRTITYTQQLHSHTSLTARRSLKHTTYMIHA